ncbi:MAG TPA: hypothetical protein VNH38_08870 [Candidatus Dormibacteraeota bacterium]|nr:hypothetical protein [Candidatus Dormibacteraeota bacterium]
MAGWNDLRAALNELRSDPRSPLAGFPNPRSDGLLPPYQVGLQAWATDIAADLHHRFGTQLELTVGFLSYPDRRNLQPVWAFSQLLAPSDPLELGASLDSPLVVPSGHALHSTVRIHNPTVRDVTLHTNGNLTAVIVDPEGGETVGGFSGLQPMPGVEFEIASGASALVPLLVGTASLIPHLGFAIPTGLWAFRAPLALQDGRSLWTPPLDITVTA